MELSLKPVESGPTSRQLVSQLNERIKHQFDVWIFRTYQYSSWLVWEEKTTKLVSRVLWLGKVLLEVLKHSTYVLFASDRPE